MLHGARFGNLYFHSLAYRRYFCYNNICSMEDLFLSGGA